MRGPTAQLYDPARLARQVSAIWEEEILVAMEEFTSIRSLSPLFDQNWMANAELDKAARFLAAWARGRKLPGIEAEILRLPGRTPTLVVEVPASDPLRSESVTLLYGHLDKQPPLDNWSEGLDPFRAVRRGDRLYGRGVADDGYAFFASLAALEAVLATGCSYGRCIVLIEGSEESGSPDLAAYLEELEPRIGAPALLICLDATCLTYDRLWMTTSLRGNVIATLGVQVMEEGVHSGLAGATVPSSFRILRHLLERIEDSGSGSLLLPELWSEPPAERLAELEELAETMERSGTGGQNEAEVHPWALPVLPCMAPLAGGVGDELVRRAWHPALELTGIGGVPPVELAGNVHRATTTAKLSFRLSPGADARRAVEAISSRLLADPPYGARISLSWNEPASGWSARPTPAWLGEAVQQASALFYGHDALSFGDGGSIPFLSMLSRMYPETEFLVTGVLGPQSNAHGPDESLHIPTAKALTSSVAHVLASLPGADNSERT